MATTRPISNSNTTSKSQGQISSREHELYNSQENLTENHNSILPTIYISIYGPYYDCALFYPNVYALSSCPLLIHHTSTLRPPYHVHVPWHHTSLISIIHMCTMCTPWGTYVPWCHSISRLFLILLDPKSFQTALDFFRPMISCHVTSQSRTLSLSLVID